MAGNIRGITIEIGGDTTTLQKALKDVEGKSRELNKELRDIDKSMKFNPDSFELLDQKARVAKEAIANLKDKLTTLKTAQEQASQALENGDIGQDQYDALSREILKTENQLKSYEKTLKESSREEVESKKAADERKKSLEDLQKSGEQLKQEEEKLSKEFKLQVAEMGNNAKESEKLAAKKEYLSKAIANAAEQVVNLEKQLKDAKQVYGENSDEVAKLEAKLADAKTSAANFANEFQAMGGKLTEVSKKFTEVGDKIESIGKSMSTKVTAPIAAGFAVAFKGAADLEDAMGATKQVFGDHAKDVDTWTSNIEDYYGVSKKEALEYANTMGSMLKNIGGKTDKEAAEMSEKLVKLAGDLSAMFGGRTEDAVRALTGALKGNNSMLDNYGMGVNEATVKTKAMEMGLVGEKEQMSLAAKQAATLALIMEQTGDAQGQAAREADGASGTMKAFQKNLKDFKDTLGEELIPIITPFIKQLNELIKKFGKLKPSTKKAIVGFGLLLAAIGPILTIFGKLMKVIGTFSGAMAIVKGATTAGATPAMIGLSKVIPVLVKGFGLIKGVCVAVGAAFNVGPIAGALALAVAIGVLIAAIKNWDKIKEFFKGVGEKIAEFCGNAKEKLGEFGEHMKETFSETWSNMKEELSKEWSDMKDSLSESWNTIKENAGETWSNIQESLSEKWNSIKEKAKEWGSTIKDTLSETWTEFSSKTSEAWGNIHQTLGEKWNGIKEKAKEWGSNLKEELSGVWGDFSENLGQTWDGIKESLSEKWGSISELAKQNFDSMGETINQAFNGIKDGAGNIIESVVSGMSGKWENMKTNAANAWDSMKDTLKNKVSDIGDAIKKLGGLKDWFSDLWNNIKERTSQKWQAIKEAAMGPLKALLQNIRDFFNKVKDLFNIKLEFPKIKLPKFKLEGKFSLNPPSVPKLSVQWNKMGGIFKKPTIFATPNGYQGVGEAGAEAIIPIEKLKDYMSEVLDKKQDKGGDTYIFNVKFDEISELEQFIKMAKAKKRIAKQGDVNA